MLLDGWVLGAISLVPSDGVLHCCDCYQTDAHEIVAFSRSGGSTVGLLWCKGKTCPFLTGAVHGGTASLQHTS
jgi:hypothetical protein